MRLATRIVAVLSCSAAASLAACGSRGPLDDGPIYVIADSGVPTTEADAAEEAAPPIADASVDAREAGVVQCGSCLLNQCAPDVLSCLGSTGCRNTLQCVVTTCLAGGSFDIKCAAGCASGDPGAAIKIFQIFQCVTSDCGPECGSLLGGLLGGLGGGGGGGGGNGGGGKGGGKGGGGGGRELTPIQQAFCVFPELRPPMALPEPR